MQHPYRATIPPRTELTPRPLWSVMIPTYNCANYLRETLCCVLAQDPGSEMMQIEVIDDHSTKDDPRAVVEELGCGRVGFYQQPENVGHTRNFETCLKRAQGKLIHLLHGDDCVRLGFYRKMQRAFEENPLVGAAFCRQIHMDEHGHWQHISPLEQPESGVLNNWLEKIAVKQRIQTPSIVVRRDVYEKLGGFDYRLSWIEDWEMWVRIATQYSVWYEVEPLALYRTHSASNSGRYVRTGENIRDVLKSIDIVRSYLSDYLPETTVNKLLNENREQSTFYALETASRMLATGDTVAGMTQIREALKCSKSLWVIKRVIRLTLSTIAPFFLKLQTSMKPHT